MDPELQITHIPLLARKYMFLFTLKYVASGNKSLILAQTQMLLWVIFFLKNQMNSPAEAVASIDNIY